MSNAVGPTFWSQTSAYITSDALVLWRMRTPLAFMFAVPAVLAVTLGPAVAGEGTHGRTMLGLAVMFSFMTINYVGLALFREFGNETWVRQAIVRPPRLAFLVGKTLPVAVAGMIQLTIFGAIALLAYDTPVNGSLAQLFLVAVALVAVGCATGVLLYNMTRSSSVFQSLTYVLLITTGSIGGAIIPTDRLPALSQALGVATPQRWALIAVDESTTGAGAWWPTAQALLVLGALTVLIGALAWRTFDYQREKSGLS